MLPIFSLYYGEPRHLLLHLLRPETTNSVLKYIYTLIIIMHISYQIQVNVEIFSKLSLGIIVLNNSTFDIYRDWPPQITGLLPLAHHIQKIRWRKTQKSWRKEATNCSNTKLKSVWHFSVSSYSSSSTGITSSALTHFWATHILRGFLYTFRTRITIFD